MLSDYIQSLNDALALQDDSYGLHSWSNDVIHLRFNLPKCKVLSVTRKSSPIVTQYNFDGQHLIHSDVAGHYDYQLQAIMEGSGRKDYV